MRIKYFFIAITTIFTFYSCASLSKYPGIGRIKSYTITNHELPESFHNFRIAFAADFHLRSKYKEKHLHQTVRAIQALNPDLLLLGGDYQEGCQYVTPLFEALGTIHPPYGIYAVLGNNDYERCTDEIRHSMKVNNICLLEHTCDTLEKQGQQIIISGVANGFDYKNYATSPTIKLHNDDYVILVTHTPDYVEDADIQNTDLVLAGHTHGGQITLFGWIVPQTGSKYGKRFLTGLNYNSQGIPVITTNGLGTSRRNIRIGAHSEIVIITLKKE